MPGSSDADLGAACTDLTRSDRSGRLSPWSCCSARLTMPRPVTGLHLLYSNARPRIVRIDRKRPTIIGTARRGQRAAPLPLRALGAVRRGSTRSPTGSLNPRSSLPPLSACLRRIPAPAPAPSAPPPGPSLRPASRRGPGTRPRHPNPASPLARRLEGSVAAVPVFVPPRPGGLRHTPARGNAQGMSRPCPEVART